MHSNERYTTCRASVHARDGAGWMKAALPSHQLRSGGFMRRPLAALATLLLTLSVAACGSDSSGGGDSSGGTISVGLLVPLTGASAQTAEQVKNVVEMHVAQVNADDG